MNYTVYVEQKFKIYKIAKMENNLLHPIHTITLEDYAAIALKLSSGVELDAILQALGVTAVQYEEASNQWNDRMAQDETFELSILYGQYFTTAANHPILGAIQTETNSEGQQHLDQMKTDRYYFERMTALRQAAYNHGIDGAAYLLEHYGITLGEFQVIALQYHPNVQDPDFDFEEMHHFMDYRQTQEAVYTDLFSKNLGIPDIGEDIEF
ncbi:hypothetical protein M2306_001515 [Myroides gitamensis]|nr:hypothetical protein [Myroides gitamensis]